MQESAIGASRETRFKPFSLDELRPLLRDGEEVIAEGKAELPIPRSRVPVIGLMQLSVRQARRSLLVDELVDAAADTAFPLDEHMVLVLTSERVLTWGGYGSPREIESLLADVPLWQIKSITTDYLPPGPKKDIRITMQDGLTVDIRVPTALADTLRNQFRRRA